MKLGITLLFGMLFANCLAQEISAPDNLLLNSPLKVDKTLVVCLSPIEGFRSSFETAMQEKLQFHGIHTETSKRYLPIILKQEVTAENELKKLIKSLPQIGFDKLIISAMSEVEHTKIDAEGYFGDFELFHFNTYLYKVDKDGTSLLWSICLCIYDYQVPLLSVKDFAKAIVDKMLEDGVLKTDEVHELKVFNF